jgi:glucose/arabinose dehydrogenase
MRLRRIHRVVLASALLASLTGAPANALPATSSEGIGIREVVGHLMNPNAFTLAPDGRFFIAERTTGRIDLFDPVSGELTLFTTITSLFVDGDSGVMGLALHPQYPIRPYLYAYASRTVGSTPREQILRFTDNGGVGTQPRVIFTGNTVANGFHQGGRILFGADGMLYAVDGDRDDPALAQDPTVDAGKMLRMTPAGKVPPDNPFPGSRVWAYGLRNSFGFTFDPLTDLLWETDNGPECNDEINIVRAARNYGWGPTETCVSPPPPPLNTNQDGPNPVLPVTYFEVPIAPVGNAFCVACGLPLSEGTMFFGNFIEGDIMRATLTPDRRAISSMDVAYATGVTGGVESIEVGPDGALYFSDNHHIYELVPA